MRLCMPFLSLTVVECRETSKTKPPGRLKVVAYPPGRLLQGHPLVPVIQASGPGAAGTDADLVLQGNPDSDAGSLMAHLLAVASRERVVSADALGNVDVQFTRGLLGISM